MEGQLMSGVSHLSMFYDSRWAVQFTDSDPSASPNTDLSHTPEAATIRYESGVTRDIDCNEYEAPNGKGYETAKWLIQRAMLDPDATVIPA
jgi:hypothetical protein